MSDSTEDDFDPKAREEREIGREMVDKSVGMGSVAAHFYRGEMSRVTTWRQRLDQTTNWAVTVIAAILIYAFSTDGRHVILLTGIVVITIFLGIEARRYQGYDVWRSRGRMLQENLFANALDPSQGVEHRDWRRELSEDYRDPKIKIPYAEALARRLQRVYLPFLFLMLAAWLFKITAFNPRSSWLTATGVGAVPGIVVVAVVFLFYAAAVGITFWPRERQAKGEFSETDYGEWTDTD
jgi:uncharacterized membrane protein